MPDNGWPSSTTVCDFAVRLLALPALFGRCLFIPSWYAVTGVKPSIAPPALEYCCFCPADRSRRCTTALVGLCFLLRCDMMDKTHDVRRWRSLGTPTNTRVASWSPPSSHCHGVVVVIIFIILFFYYYIIIIIIEIIIIIINQYKYIYI